MATNYAKHMKTTQTEQADPRQKKNNAGGFTFVLDKWKTLDRFLILGAEGGTYYVSERKLTRDNATNLIACLTEDAPRTIARIVEVSERGLAPKNDAAVFALAVAASSDSAATRATALTALPLVCRIGTHLFQFVEAVNGMRGWGRQLKRAVSKWYSDCTPESLAYQMLKYQQRAGWSHKDVLRLAHAESLPLGHRTVVRELLVGNLDHREVKRGGKQERSITYEKLGAELLPPIIGAVAAIKSASASDAAKLIREHGLTHEMVPNEIKGERVVWEALLEKMPLGAMVRNLGKMTSIELIAPMSEASNTVREALSSKDAIKKARLHPIALLSALRVYSQGHGERGSLTWKPDPKVIDALDEAFYLAFETIEPTGKAQMLALDVSGSMSGSVVAGIPGLSARDVSAAMAMATLRVEQKCVVFGFSSQFIELKISARQRLDDVVRYLNNLPFSSTDCSLPMIYAAEKKMNLEAISIYTDNETFAGRVHPHTALQDYRARVGHDVKLVVCGTDATPFTIADPTDAGMLDVVGFSSDCPAVIANFIAAR